MLNTSGATAVLIRENTPLPANLAIQSEVFLPGWRLIKNLDGYGLDREIREAGWIFFCLAGEAKATVFGIDEETMVRRAIEQILGNRARTNPAWVKFNSLEITHVSSAASRRFLGVCCVTVSARSRHIQQSVGLTPAKEFVVRKLPAAPGPRLDSSVEVHHAEVTA
jgi:hypothetical protein